MDKWTVEKFETKEDFFNVISEGADESDYCFGVYQKFANWDEIDFEFELCFNNGIVP